MRDLLVAEIGPREEQQDVALLGPQRGERRGEPGTGPGGVDALGHVRARVEQRVDARARVRAQLALLAAVVVTQEVDGDAEESRPRVRPVEAVALPALERLQERLCRQLLGDRRFHAPPQEPVHRVVVADEHGRERRWIVERVADCRCVVSVVPHRPRIARTARPGSRYCVRRPAADPRRFGARIASVDRRDFLATAAAVPFGLAVGPAAFGWRYGGTPTALVTADTEAHVAAVDLTTGRVLRRIRTRPGPRSIEAASELIAIVAHTGEGLVTLVDGPSLTVRRVLRGFGEPRYAGVHPDRPLAYITDSARGEVVTVDLLAGRVLHRTEVGGPARHVSVDPAGRLLWTALGNKARRIAVVSLADATRPQLLARLRPPFLAHDVGFAPRGRRVWVTSGDRAGIALYDLRGGRVLRTLPAGAPPQHVAFVGARAYVTSGDDGTLRVHALEDGRVARTTAVPVGSYNVQHAQGRVLTPSLALGTLCLLDARGRLLRRVRVAPSSHDACFVMSR